MHNYDSNALFSLHAPFRPAGDQPQAIAALCLGLAANQRFQTLEGVTGSGKTFTLANVIARWGRPTLIVSHNKTLAAQLYQELKSYFPANAVEYFVSYYDYYQPEAYIPQTDTFIEKDAAINEDIERMRLAATNSLMNRDDVIIVASVSCIYGLGSPEDYREMLVTVAKGETVERDELLRRLVDIQYARNDYEPQPGTFRVRGDTLDIHPAYSQQAIRINMFGDEVESIARISAITGDVEETLASAIISPARHFVMPASRIEPALRRILAELEERVRWFEANDKLLEAQRIRMRTTYDMEMLKEMGYCAGVENYSRHLSGRAAGEAPATLMDYFRGEFLTVVDESHVGLPQIRGMFNGDQSRKQALVDHGFRLPSARDNRPLNYEEFLKATGQIIFMSATPSPYELQVSPAPVRQIIRPTGLLDPPVSVRPLKGQIDDLIEEVRVRAERHERTLVTTLTKKTAEDLSDYLRDIGLRVTCLHSDVETLERVEILRSLRKGDFDCLVGVNLLREGLDLPEVSLVAVLDADKEGFLRSETSLIQISGRAARHMDGAVILYADRITDSMRRALKVMTERRQWQEAYNLEHGITPQTIVKSIQEGLALKKESEEAESRVIRETGEDYDAHELIREIGKEMVEAADALEFERAAILRDQLFELRSAQKIAGAPPPAVDAGKKEGSYSVTAKPRRARRQRV
jgi:excinuclease ABC subunit B